MVINAIRCNQKGDLMTTTRWRLNAATLAFAVAGLISPAAADVIRVGAPLSLTGALADSGEKSAQGFEMCLDAVNARGGVQADGKMNQLQLVKYDYESDTNRAVQMMQRLVTVDKVSFLLGPYGSGDTKATAVVAERYGVPMVAWSAASEAVFDQKFKNLFGVLSPNQIIVDTEIAFYKEKVPGLKRLAILAQNSLFPKANAESLKRAALKAGLEVVYEGLYAPGTTELINPLTEIKSKKPDWVYVYGYTLDLILARRQMLDVGLDAKVISQTAGPAFAEFPDNLKDQANGITSNSWWVGAVPYKDAFMFGSANEYAATFKAKYKKDPTYLEAAASAACEVLVQSIEKAGTVKADAVRQALRETSFDTFYGPIKFGENGQNTESKLLVTQIQNRKNIVVGPEALKAGDLIVGKEP